MLLVFLLGLVHGVVASQLKREILSHQQIGSHYRAVQDHSRGLVQARHTFVDRSVDAVTGPVQPDSTPDGAVPSADAGSHEEKTHHSIFALHLSTVDVPAFWKIFLIIVLSIASAERAQTYAYRMAEENRTLQKFVDSVCRELMLFGFVAVGVFVFTNCFIVIDEDTYILCELVDLIIAFSAWALIIMSGVFMGWSNISRNQWLALHTGENEDRAEVEVFEVLASRFKRKMKLKHDFLFHWYMDECLAFNCTAVMEVEWQTWLLFLILPAFALTVRVCIGHSLTDKQFLDLLTLLNWISFSAHALMASWINNHYHKMRASVVNDDGYDLTDPFQERAEMVLFALQYMSLCNVLLLAFFLMAGLYNNALLNTGAFYILCQALPLLVVIAYLFPVLLSRFSVLQGYYCPNGEVIGYVLEQDKQFEEDLASLRKAYNDRGRPVVRDFAGGRKEFQEVLSDLKIYISADRRLRLFLAMDLDRDGVVTKKEFDSVLVAPTSDLLERRRSKTRAASKISIASA